MAGALQRDEYLDVIRAAGFAQVEVQRERTIELPDAFLRTYLSPADREAFLQNQTAIRSVTVYAER
ncbi:MAG: hypothetical protein OHK0039_11610 [Bacteroidia bacterium]